MLVDTFFWAAASARTAGTPDIAAAVLRTALAAADTNQYDEEQSTEDNEQHSQPVWEEEGIWPSSASIMFFRFEQVFSVLILTIHNESDFFIRVSHNITGCIDGAEIHAVVPPHHLIDNQVSICEKHTEKNYYWLLLVKPWSSKHKLYIVRNQQYIYLKNYMR